MCGIVVHAAEFVVVRAKLAWVSSQCHYIYGLARLGNGNLTIDAEWEFRIVVAVLLEYLELKLQVRVHHSLLRHYFHYLPEMMARRSCVVLLQMRMIVVRESQLQRLSEFAASKKIGLYKLITS